MIVVIACPSGPSFPHRDAGRGTIGCHQVTEGGPEAVTGQAGGPKGRGPLVNSRLLRPFRSLYLLTTDNEEVAQRPDAAQEHNHPYGGSQRNHPGG